MGKLSRLALFFLVFALGLSASAGVVHQGVKKSAGPIGSDGSGPDVELSNLILYAKLDEGTGTSAADSSSGGHAGTLTNGPSWIGGGAGCKSGDCLAFNTALSQHIVLGTPPISGDDPSWSVCAWFKSTQTATGTIYGEGNSGTSNQLLKIAISEDVSGDLSWQYRDNAIVDVGTVTININTNDGNWHQVCAVSRSKTDREIYLDKVSRAKSTATLGTCTFNKANIGVFERTTKSNYFDGRIDQVRVYDLALTTTQIANIYDNNK